MPLCVPIRRVAALVAVLGCGMAAPAAWADTYLVTQVGDSGFGSLRQAILDANARPGDDEILFALGPIGTPPVFLNLDTALPSITDSVRIVGPGSNLVITQRNPIGNPPNFAIFRATGNISFEVRGLSITAGTGSQGAAISATGGTLTIANCLIFENDNTDIGGAIAVVGTGDCNVNISNSQLFANTAGNMGGGIAVIRNGGRANVTLTGVAISRNNLVNVSGGNLGGGLYVAGTGGPHTVNITGCTIDSNAISVDGVGGGIYVDGAGGSITITNSTIASNNASMGAAIAYRNASLAIRGCTITANTTVSDATGGCIKDLSNAGFTVSNTILSANTSAFQLRDLGNGQVASGNNNLIGVGGPFVNGVNGNIVGVTNPRLVPINTNGGPTLTFALQPDSPAIDAGSNADSPPTDQRGQPRPADGDNNGTAIADIGAFESQRFLVTNTNTSGPGSLRQAIEDNNTAGGGFVRFNISPLGSANSIVLGQTLPEVSRIVFIDGWSQGGPGYRGSPLIEIDGAQLSNSIGLDIKWSDCIIRGLAINNYSGALGNGVGIRISEQAGLRNWLYGNYIGVGLDGVSDKGNGQIGVWLAISANTNLVGTNADGINDEVERNVISGSRLHGLRTGVFIQSNSNVIAGNLIGTNAAGLAAVPNFNGVWVENGTSNRIGSSPFSANPLAERNIISGNQNAGVSFTSQGSNNSISGNFIGLTAAGNTGMPNLIGVLLENVNQTLVGGTHNGARNVISGNAQHGVLISGTGATGNLIQGNYIGTDALGELAIGNAAAGILVRSGASNNRIGAFGDNNPTFEPLRRNVISASGGRGVVIRDSSSQANRVLGNFIGTTKTGLLPLGNMNAGVAIDDSPSNIVGSIGSGRNVIAAGRSAVNGNGVEITGSNAQGNKVQNNLIGLGVDGLTQLPNTVAGVSIATSAAFNLVGGTSPGEGNLIRSNTGAGVRVLSDESIANAILGNSIFASGSLGIDLKDDGVTPNGPPAALRIGPNNLQNYPVIQSVSVDGLITCTLESAANTTFRIEYFASTTPDPSGYGEGLTYLGARTVTTNQVGLTGEFTFTASLIPGQPWITTTATRLAPSIESVTGFPTPPGTPLGTSEFSLARRINSEPTTTNVSASTLEDTDVIVTLLANDLDPNTTLSFRVATLPARGSLLQFGSLTPITSNDTPVTDPSGRVVFRPDANTFAIPYTSFTFVANDGIVDSQPGPATINVSPVADTPSVTNATTREDVQTTSGLVISRNPVDGAEVTHFWITNIQNGVLFKNDGVTPIASGDFITFAEGAAGLKFTPALNSTATGSFDVQAALGASPANIGGGSATALIFVTAVADTPSVTNATTLEDIQSTSGLVISRNIVDGPEVTHFRITNLSGGQLFLADGTTPVTDGQFIPAAQASAGLRLTPPADFFGSITLNVQAAVGPSTADLGGSTALATVIVRPVNDRPTFAASDPSPSLEDAGDTVVTSWATFSPGPANESDQIPLAYTVSGISDPTLFSTPPSVDASGTLRYRAAPDRNGTSQITVTVRDNGGVADGGVDTSSPQTFTITVLPVNDAPALIASNPPAVLEDSGAAVVNNWASINPGPSDESAQVALAYAVSNVSDPTLFTALPTVDAAGTLRYTPAANAFGSAQFTVTARDNGGTANGGVDTSPSRTFTIVVGPVNDRPTFAASDPSPSLEDAGDTAVPAWAMFSPGPANESDQTPLAYAVTGITDAALFSTLPSVDASGTLRYRSAPNRNGTSQITVTVRDSGGTADGGVDTSLPQTFTITVLPVNDPPELLASNPPAVLEDSGAAVVNNWASINPGPSDESSQIALAYSVSNVSEPTLFASLPTIDAAGTLRYTPAANAFGSAQFTITARDNGGTANGGVDTSAPRTFTIVVGPVNDQPTFSASNPVASLEDSGPLVVSGWAMFNPGPTNESTQAILGYAVSGVTNASLFASQPSIDASGTLRYTPAPDAFGTAQFTVTAQDDGGTANGGIDTSAPQTFTITVLPVNDPPTFTAAAPPAVLQDASAQTVTGFITGFSPGPSNESAQTALAYVVDNVSNPGLFEEPITVSSSGTLSYVPASGVFGSSTFRVRVRDNGGTSNGGLDTSAPQTFTIIVRPAAVCQNVFIDARRTCVARTVQPSQINRTPGDPSSGATQTFSYSRNLNQDFPIGSTPVVVTVDYSDGLRSQCIATVTVVASDCNDNGIPDACESFGGTLRDCNNDGVPDDCQCIWNNGFIDPSTAPSANGQLSHNGGAVVLAVQTADDFYLAPGNVYPIFGFQGQMFTNSFPTVRKARLSFFEDCNGRPADQPFKTYLSTGILSTVPGPTDYDLVTYDFDFCSDGLVLDGGKSYWVSLVGLSDGTGKDSSYWVTTTPQSVPNAMIGLPPVKRTGTPGSAYNQFVFDPWQPAEECCAGCVNMAWKLNGMSCQILHDNGKPATGSAAGGRVSGADRANPLPPRSADDFVLKPCVPVEVCLVETYIWTNCSPTTGFIELFNSTTCGDPGLTPIYVASNPRYESLNQQIVADGTVLNLYKLTFRNLGWALAPGTNYWLSTGASSGGSINGRTLFAYAGSCRDFTCRTQQFNTARFLDRYVDPPAWARVSGAHAFRVAVTGSPLNGAPPAQPGAPAPCSTDVNSDRATNVQDIFDFLNAWFTGCP